MRVLVLGHSGMLGSAVKKYYAFAEVETTEYRWPSDELKRKISEFDGDLIINCLGAIPQRTNNFSINYEVPAFLCSHCLPEVKILHPTSDCAFDGTSDIPYQKDHPCNATSEYGKSKNFQAPLECRNFMSIRTSFIGHDMDNKELLSWFLSSEEPVNGYTNHLWNGITTYEWAKLSHQIYEEWLLGTYPNTQLIQLGTEPITKYDLLTMIKDVYACDTLIVPFTTQKPVNRSLVSDFEIKPLLQQLKELREIYNTLWKI
tara:strand:+ start:417 stop:1193 length:777 start_codon:yes stop_codon:yes gene_type:complete